LRIYVRDFDETLDGALLGQKRERRTLAQ